MKDKDGDFDPIIPKFDFNWPTFHHNLDRALATYLEDGGSIHDEIIKFVEYSYARRMKVSEIFEAFEEEG
jgi:hypothetical protein